ncbi:MAG: hypothetical protein OXG35_30770 [Acidobacteria bacterium]|nr:hypothetical protein [Acidobacteriota bacterium]
MQIEIALDSETLKAFNSAKCGETFLTSLGRVMGAVFEQVPNHQREGIQDLTSTASGHWSPPNRVKLYGETAETLQKCATALDCSDDEAFSRGVRSIPADPPVFSG